MFNNLNDIFITTISITIGTIGGFVLTSYIYDSMLNSDIHMAKEIPYEWKIPLDTPKDMLEEKEENINNGVVEEETPDGNVILKYDDYKESFIYYGPKNVQYKYLETVAKKYAILFDCKDKMINIFKELYDAWEKVEKIKEDEKTNNNKDVQDNGPFASFKTYNSGTMGSSSVDKGKKNESNNKYKIVNEKANRYSYMGTIDEYVESLKIKEEKKVKEIDWMFWKKNS